MSQFNSGLGSASVGTQPTAAPTNKKKQQPPMSPTAGPISAAMGVGAPNPTNFASGLSQVTPPKMTAPTSMNPLSIAQNLTDYQNQANTANNTRYNQALSVLGQGQQTSKADIAGYGQQELGRIDLNLQNQLGGVQQNAISRGLGNTTVADTMTYMPQRQAADARLGVTEMQGRLNSGIDTGAASSIAGLIGSRQDQAPDASMYSQLMQGAAAGNYGQKPNFSGQTQNYAPPSQPFGGGAGGGGSAQNQAAQQGYNQTNTGVPGYYSGGGGGDSYSGGYSGGGGGGGGQIAQSMQQAGASDAYSPSMNAAGYGDGSISIQGQHSGVNSPGGGAPMTSWKELPNGPDTSSGAAQGPISSAAGAQQPVTVSHDMAQYYSMVWGPNWQQMIGQGAPVQIG